MVDIILSTHPWIITKNMIIHPNALSHLIMDPSWFRKDIGSPNKGLPNIMTKETTDKLEIIGRTFCYQVYKRRFELLANIDDTDSETDCDDSYSLHDITTSTENDSSIQ